MWFQNKKNRFMPDWTNDLNIRSFLLNYQTFIIALKPITNQFLLSSLANSINVFLVQEPILIAIECNEVNV